MTQPTSRFPITNDSVFIDATAFKKHITCDRSFEYYFVDKRQSGDRRVPLEAGAIFHEVMEWRRLLENVPSYTIEAIEHEQEQIAHLLYAGWRCSVDSQFAMNYIRQRHPEVEGLSTSSTEGLLNTLYPGFTPPLDDFRTETNCIDTLRAYNREYPMPEPFDILKLNGRPMVEIPFAFPIMTVNVPELHPRPFTFYWTGKIDTAVEYPDGVWGQDIKTGSRNDGFDEYANDQAQIGYLWAIHKLTGLLPRGFCIDKVFWRKPTKGGKGTEFIRHREAIEPERIAEWEHNTIAILEDILRNAVRDFYPMKSEWCKGKYSTCEYLNVCKMPPKGRRVMLMSDFYKDVTWSPLHRGAGEIAK